MELTKATKKDIIILCLLLILLITAIYKVNHTASYEIYTSEDILYVERGRSFTFIRSETGDTNTCIPNSEVYEYLATITGKQSRIDNDELYRIMTNYVTVSSYNYDIALEWVNPYTNNRFGVEMNRIDTSIVYNSNSVIDTIYNYIYYNEN